MSRKGISPSVPYAENEQTLVAEELRRLGFIKRGAGHLTSMRTGARREAERSLPSRLGNLMPKSAFVNSGRT